MRRVIACSVVALSLGSCAPLQAQCGSSRFAGFGLMRTEHPVFLDGGREVSRYRPPYPSRAAYYMDPREEEELEFRFRRRQPQSYSAPRSRSSYYDPCEEDRYIPRGRSRQWLLLQTPSGRLRTFALDPND